MPTLAIRDPWVRGPETGSAPTGSLNHSPVHRPSGSLDHSQVHQPSGPLDHSQVQRPGALNSRYSIGGAPIGAGSSGMMHGGIDGGLSGPCVPESGVNICRMGPSYPR